MSRKNLKNLAKEVHEEAGAAIAGERVVAQARSIGKYMVVAGSSNHRIQQSTLKGNVLCVVDRAFRIREGKIRLKSDKKQ